MSLLGLDLNLLLALNALLEEQHVTRAGNRIGLSQPAMSDALRRLRRHFDDDLLLRAGNVYELTPLALVLRQRTAEAVDKVEFAFASRSAASMLDRQFIMFASGNGLVNFVRPLLDDLRVQGIDLRLRVIQFDVADTTGEAIGKSDGILAPRDFAGSFPSIDLYRDRWTVVTAHGRDTSLSLDTLADRPWIIPFDSPQLHSPPLRRLRSFGISPKPELFVDDFLSIPLLVADSDRVSVLPRRLAVRFPSLIDVHDGAFDAPDIIESFVWHPIHTANPSHVWFRRQLGESARRLDLEP
ncbi:LysR family transcriptional regulator [Rhodococcoides fascians]|uniref:LysR family transcriptional regulator n=1 Tax=Rhodococcoides fascians TaxID=1828 RepID=UPI00050CA101|nr:LysR family transcriptional regulator [Rhodococcus fascians]